MIDNYIKIAIISDIVFEPYLIPLMKFYFGDKILIFTIPFQEYNDEKHKNRLKNCEIIIAWLNFESLFTNIVNFDYTNVIEKQNMNEIVFFCEKLCKDLLKFINVQILWFLFEDYFSHSSKVFGKGYNSFVDEINIKLCEKLDKQIVFINLKQIIAEIGIDNAYSLKNKYRWNAPYSKALVEAAAQEIYKQHLIEQRITPKCLVLDCDNVLWGGILSEDGLENIKLGSSGIGRSYQDFQRFILSFYYHGVILAICSKNDLPDVTTVFREHEEMILKEEHIACFQVNWESKPNNIKKISEILNINLNSIIFIDDLAAEIEAVKMMLPEVHAIQYKRDTIFEQLSCFNLHKEANIDDVMKRNETYRTNQSRAVLKAQNISYDDYIKALDIKVDIHDALLVECSRIAELTQRTNRCTNGKRYTAVQIKERIYAEDIKLYSLSVSDRFSDLGIVGVIEIQKNTLLLFSLSCRALGRGIENKMIRFITERHIINEIEFNPTDQNKDLEIMLMKEFPNAVIRN